MKFMKTHPLDVEFDNTVLKTYLEINEAVFKEIIENCYIHKNGWNSTSLSFRDTGADFFLKMSDDKKTGYFATYREPASGVFFNVHDDTIYRVIDWLEGTYENLD